MEKHIPVLLREVVDGLSIQPDDHVLDMTLGDGGHSLAMTQHLTNKGLLIGIDQDSDILEIAREKLKGSSCKLIFETNNFSNAKTVLAKHKIQQVDKVLFDLGIRNGQIFGSKRGFSFKTEEPLLMTMKADLGPEDLTAEKIVNTWQEESIADILYGYGDERFSRRIARKIVEIRSERTIRTTFDLVDVINQAVPAWYKKRKIHPATKTFQALRIAVNDELGVLKQALATSFSYLRPNGRIAVISYHSLEDRIVKRFFKDRVQLGQGLVLNKKPVVPSREEIQANPKARSAKLRIFQRRI